MKAWKKCAESANALPVLRVVLMVLAVGGLSSNLAAQEASTTADQQETADTKPADDTNAEDSTFQKILDGPMSITVAPTTLMGLVFYAPFYLTAAGLEASSESGKRQQALAFFRANRDEIAAEAAQGGGPFLTTLSALTETRQDNAVLQAAWPHVFRHGLSSDQIYDRILAYSYPDDTP